jgi:hypothetical protein
MANKQEYLEFGLNCSEACEVLSRGLNGRRLEDLSQSVLEGIQRLTT